MKSEEYEEKILNNFLGNRIVRVLLVLGLEKDSFEIRMTSGKFTFDLFLTYKLNSTHQMCGYQVYMQKFRYNLVIKSYFF